MKKKILLFFLFLWLLLIGTGYLTGNYFVNYALKRGGGEDPLGPPKASEKIGGQLYPNPPFPSAQAFREDWSIQSEDGLKLVAACLHPKLEKPHHWAILVHGYGKDKDFTWDYAEEYLKEGYVTLSPDLRSSGESEGTYLTMGEKESDDLKLWAEEIVRQDPDAKIVMHGVSMGAATVMMASAKDLPPNVVAAVEDCGYTSSYDIFSTQLGVLFGLPKNPIMPCVDIVCYQKIGTTISHPAPIDSVAQSKLPMLFIHGDEDKLVPYEMMQQLYDASTSPVKEQVTVHGAKHAMSKKTDPQAYFEKIFTFLQPFM